MEKNIGVQAHSMNVFEINMKTGGMGLTPKEQLRWIDVLVAEHLFGWTWKNHYRLKTQKDFIAPDGTIGIHSRRNVWQFTGSDREPYVPLYTVGPEWTFKVLEWLLKYVAERERGLGIRLVDFSPHYPKPFMCSESAGTGVGLHGTTIGEAICRFALNLKGMRP